MFSAVSYDYSLPGIKHLPSKMGMPLAEERQRMKDGIHMQGQHQLTLMQEKLGRISSLLQGDGSTPPSAQPENLPQREIWLDARSRSLVLRTILREGWECRNQLMCSTRAVCWQRLPLGLCRCSNSLAGSCCAQHSQKIAV
ncbi:hypothetical protein EJ08DRAFT_18701 [Tothia fuscella]|uniref:Uncharacterized protein n=1 Tax=Tothia fuscella TaxID=1048955 RepID=A0A9P4NX07_9PEZI|nr:hypothetical protein EJ08DRAFT_18701 [Tothia fuscella]